MRCCRFRGRSAAIRRGAVRVAWGQHDGKARLSLFPVILHDVVLDQDVAGVLQLEDVLDLPPRAAPLHRPSHVVVADQHVAGHQVRDGRIGAPEQKDLAGRFQVVVLDGIRPGAVPAADGLRVGPDGFDVADITVADRRGAGVQRDAALLSGRRIAVNVDAIDDDLVGDLRQL